MTDHIDPYTRTILENEPWLAQELPNFMAEFEPCRECPALNSERGTNLPGQRAILEFLDEMVTLLFPGCHGSSPVAVDSLESETAGNIVKISVSLRGMIARVLAFYCHEGLCRQCGDCEKLARETTLKFLRSLPAIRQNLHTDIEAAYLGDPAARSRMEVVMSYPGLYAVAVHRLAHSLHTLEVPLIPRVISEHAHSRTGIDIHPGATIGEAFFIDHGTGVVIGETCTIGRNVKLYQGVTLGAFSFAKDEHGNILRGHKRHPDVEDDVVIYAGATILGGETRIGRGSVIGANVWLTHSVPPGSKVYNRQPGPTIKSTLQNKP